MDDTSFEYVITKYKLIKKIEECKKDPCREFEMYRAIMKMIGESSFTYKT